MSIRDIEAALAAHNEQAEQGASIVHRVYRWIENQVKTAGLTAGIRAAENTVDGFGPYGNFPAARKAADNFLTRYA